MYTLNEGEDHIFDDEEQLPYIHLRKLGSGHCGLVEKVRDQNTNMVFARKTIQISSTRAKKEKVHIFKNEVAVIRRLNHHHFIRVFATYMTQDEIGLILQPVADQGDLARYLGTYCNRMRDAGSPGEDAELAAMRPVLEQALGCLTSGLAYMHGQQVRHKDIKPQNILVHQGTVIFTDFGYSLDTSRLSTSVTEGPPNFWTRRYSAPEVIEYEKRDSRSDVWSLGCVLIEVLSALTGAFKIDEDQYYSKVMGDIHDNILSAPISNNYSSIVGVIVEMTSLEAPKRPRSKNLAARILCHPGFSCLSCRLEAYRTKNEYVHETSAANEIPHAMETSTTTLSTTESTGWYWSEPHNAHYRVAYDREGQITYHWHKEEQQTVAAALSQVTPDSVNSSNSLYGQKSMPEPATPVSQKIRHALPDFIAGTPDQGWCDNLDSAYQVHTGAGARRFFVRGRVFAMLYTEAAGGTARPAPDDDAFTVVRFGAHALTQIRRFVVVSVRRNFVQACAISTYRNQGTFKRGCDPGEHALIYNCGVDPESCYFLGEKENGLYKNPIMVHPANDSTRLTKESRIRFGKIYSIEWIVKVKDIGIVADEDMDTLIAHHNEEERRYG